ncbi:MAG: hypothetical protein H6644_19450 [Caldilineaceae bacterium]|nr:hypothetical protein [Caldilineaceae bacterium]
MSDANAAFQTDRPFADFELRLQETADGFAVEAVVARERTVRGTVFPRDVIEGWANADDPVRAAADMSAPLFAEAVEDAFIQARKLADDGVRVRINLDGAAALVNRLPWGIRARPVLTFLSPSILTGPLRAWSGRRPQPRLRRSF